MLKMDYEGKTVDIHGMSEPEAIVCLNNVIDGLEKAVRAITIVHGYRGGTVLQTMVRKRYRHKRIKNKIRTFNPGETVFLLYNSFDDDY
ncbi:MAG: Smr/MutS family protein [Erysipelotrichaceae bacterium]|nr:Smr/MutS family protein [Erysipelotrichaceae bacterium]